MIIHSFESKRKWVIQLIKQLPRGAGFGRTYTGKNLYLNVKGRFSGFDTNTWVFDTKKEAELLRRHFDCLEDFAVIKKVTVNTTVELLKQES